MKKTLVCVLSGGVLAAGVAMAGASAQNATLQPGQPTQARVWIQNRGNAEAIPVTLQTVSTGMPAVRVQVTEVPPVTIAAGTVQARAVRQAWDYQGVRIADGQDPVPTLNAAGGEGWEATGAVIANGGGTLVVMKRPR